MPVEEFTQANGRMGPRMAKDFSNRKMARCILEHSRMDRDTKEASYMNKTGSMSLFTTMEIS